MKTNALHTTQDEAPTKALSRRPRGQRALQDERDKRAQAEKALRETRAVLADALAGNLEQLWSVRLSDENDELEPDELLVRAPTREKALTALEPHCRMRADGWESRTFTVTLWRVVDGTGVLEHEDAGTHRLLLETLCTDCNLSEDEHLRRKLPEGCCANYELGSDIRCTTTMDVPANAE